MSQLVGLKRFNLRKALSLRLRPRLPPRAGVQVAFSCVGPRLEGVFERFGLLESLREDQQTGNAGKGWESCHLGLGVLLVPTAITMVALYHQRRNDLD